MALPVPPPPPHLPLVPPDELARRAAAFAAKLRHDRFDGAFLLHPSSTFWISGTLAQGWPFVDAGGAAFLPLRGSLGRAAHESPLPQAPVRRTADLPGVLAELGAQPAERIGVELDVVPVAAFESLKRAFPDAELVDVSDLVREARAVKSAYEVSWIERAGRIVGRAMDEALPARVHPGVPEIELMAFLEGTMRADRHQGIVRMRRWNLEMHYGTVSAGASAAYPCYFDGPDGLEGLYPAVQQGGGERRIERNVPVLVDFVGAAGGYLADRTRVFCVGSPPAEANAAHDFCREVLAVVTSGLRPGAVPSAVYAEAMNLVARSPWADRFMGWGENQVGFIGHGIGIDLDELPVVAPRFDAPLEVGNVLAVEPKVVLGGAGAVGVENTYVVTEDGCRNLTPGPEEIRIVGAARERYLGSAHE
ncbi:MAG: M24 family metallopeptidase [Candidatus Eiseniibacteriota bacterium]